jgi:rare lipoprotein A
MSVRGPALRAFFLVCTAVAALGLGACSELKFGVSVVKSMQGAPDAPASAPARAQGTYKVGEPYQIAGAWYYPAEDWNYSETGIASFYGGERSGTNFHGKLTANGELYDMNSLTAAHTTLPMPSLVRVTNMDNGRSIVLRVNDRGPFARGRIIDVSRRAAQLLGFEGQGTARVRVDIMAEDSLRLKAELTGRGDEMQTVAAAPRTSVASDALPPPPGSRETRTAAAALPPPSATLPPVQTDRSRVGTTTRQGRPRETQVPLARQADPIQTQAAQDLPPPAPVAAAPAPPVQGRSGPAASPRGPATAPARPAAAPGGSREVAALPVEQQAAARPVLTQGPAERSSLWVQAGAFGSYENAYRLSVRLSRYGSSRVVPVTLNGSQLYRVRVGPIADVKDADRMLEQMAADVPEARIVVD